MVAHGVAEGRGDSDGTKTPSHTARTTAHGQHSKKGRTDADGGNH